MKPEQDKACVGNISRQRWNLSVNILILNNGLNQSSVIWGKEWHSPVEVKLHLRFHSCQWWGSLSRPTPNGDYYHAEYIAGSVTVAGRKDFGNPTGAPGWCSPPSPPSPPPRQPPSSRLQNNFDDWRILHFHQIQRITLLVRILFLHFNLFTFSQFHWKISFFPIIFNHEYGSSSHLRRISPESSCL